MRNSIIKISQEPASLESPVSDEEDSRLGDFYKQKEIPLPRTYPDVRTIKRMRDLTLIKPFPGKCFFCAKEIIHYYPPEFGYKKIACEACYLKEVV